jgi:hypothetical protein
VKIHEGDMKMDGRAGRLSSRAEMRRIEQAMERKEYPWPVRVPGGSQACCTNYMGFISARSKKIENTISLSTNLNLQR